MSVFFLAETAVFFALSRAYGFGAGFFLIFLAAEAAFHLVIFLFLAAKRNFFYNITSGEAEGAVNIPNKLSLFRITMLPFLSFLIFASNRQGAGPTLVFAAALTFLTDFIDGRLARARGLETYMGKLLDSAGDYLLLGTTAAAFFAFAQLKPWLFFLIIGRLFINALGMLILFLIRKKLSPQTTPFGKAAIAAIMVLLVLEAAAPFLGFPFWMRYAEIAAGVIAGLSVIDKVIYFIRTAGEAA